MKFVKSIYLHSIFYWVITAIAVTSVLGFFFPIFYGIAKISCLLFVVAIGFDFFLLYRIKEGVQAQRSCPEKLSNGDENPIQISIQHNYNFTVSVTLIDEIPIQFQKRDFNYLLSIKPGEEKQVNYNLRPVNRGEYHFGVLNVYVSSFLNLIKRRYKIGTSQMVPCYPSYMQMRQYELMAISNRLTDFGVKKIRRIGHQMEFDQIREYVKGDDYRTINWKATARKSQIMVNQYQDEKAQPVYSIIDCGRSMKMPFNGLSLLDYAINTSLVISNTAVIKHDKAGLLCFGKNVHANIPAGGRRTQVKKIMEVLYNQETDFPEPNYELLYTSVKHYVRSRSLLMLYTNFESLDSMKRQLPYLQGLAKDHLLVVVFFSNSEIREMIKKPSESIEDIYVKTIGEKFLYDKKLIVKELEKYGIHAILTDPKDLTINSLNKYLELKSRGLI
ncbi:DUF58 domain-containing protein [Marinifilum caeruleilacunae]|uniref:DUF58 domain-containing protein n=1 Tax=Marinifilum caeruleilacunae TaxID=2499076 RepID=A0ABX1WSX1_9BACT|nr:DUF58 domain-containing protein [Marinifilum caeruleilacunae]NOU59162.1 DUF58 domain-containing protein [Marinifilum caeruleilacunae]